MVADRDHQEFLLQILEKVWSTQVRVVKAHDPKHLVFGDARFLNSLLPDDIIRLCSKRFPRTGLGLRTVIGAFR